MAMHGKPNRGQPFMTPSHGVATSFGLGLQRRRRKAGNRSFILLHPLLHPERRLVLDLHKAFGIASAPGDAIPEPSKSRPCGRMRLAHRPVNPYVRLHACLGVCAGLNHGGILGRDSGSFPARLIFNEFPVVMRNQRSLMGQGKSDEHPPHEELIV
ncbi:hypothetical protein Taro_004669 [Colocasia esculenta]|uniref:Uncharacterized protein n=1 Tax=Colocasia esculenta TaxID=4460 RepID=A0A843TSD2_COLES|nr:hypothetical protein [Colocasia esculenta]